MTVPISGQLASSSSAAPAASEAAYHAPLWPEITGAALRVVAGLMLMQHGVQKLFGWLLAADSPFAGAPAAFSQMWFAGTLETFGGLLLAFGLFTRPVAFVLSGEMAAAYFIAHAGRGLWPVLNGGELAALYCFVFLSFAAAGGGQFSLDGVLRSPRAAGPPKVPPVESRPPAPYPERRKQRRRSRARTD